MLCIFVHLPSNTLISICSFFILLPTLTSAGSLAPHPSRLHFDQLGPFVELDWLVSTMRRVCRKPSVRAFWFEDGSRDERCSILDSWQTGKRRHLVDHRERYGLWKRRPFWTEHCRRFCSNPTTSFCDGEIAIRVVDWFERDTWSKQKNNLWIPDKAPLIMQQKKKRETQQYREYDKWRRERCKYRQFGENAK